MRGHMIQFVTGLVVSIVAHDTGGRVVVLESWIHGAIICEHLLDRIALAMHPIDVTAGMLALVPSAKVIEREPKLSRKCARRDVLGRDEFAAILRCLALLEKAAQRPRPSAE